MWHGTHPSQLPRRLPDPPRSDGPSRDLQRVPDPNRQYSMPRTVTSIEARLTESQRRILPKRIPDPPDPTAPAKTYGGSLARIGNFPGLGQVPV